MPKLVAKGLKKPDFDDVVSAIPLVYVKKDQGGHHDEVSLLSASLRIGLVLIGALIMLIPWGTLFMIEEVIRYFKKSPDSFRARRFGWGYLSLMYTDVIRISTFHSPFSNVRWNFPEHLSHDHIQHNRKLMVLTIDDAPGDNPEELGALLDTLKELKVTATFFCTTNTIQSNMMPLMWRIVTEGHEVANHCPDDRPYSKESEKSFEKELDKSTQVLVPLFEVQDNQKFKQNNNKNENDKNGTSLTISPKIKSWRWFRAPQAQMSNQMARVLQRRGYSNVLGDCFSNDVFVGGSLKNISAGPKTIKWHTDYCMNRVRPGSIAIFHVPQKNTRLLSRDVIFSFITAAEERGLYCVSLSDLAEQIDLNENSLAEQLRSSTKETRI